MRVFLLPLAQIPSWLIFWRKLLQSPFLCHSLSPLCIFVHVWESLQKYKFPISSTPNTPQYLVPPQMLGLATVKSFVCGRGCHMYLRPSVWHVHRHYACIVYHTHPPWTYFYPHLHHSHLHNGNAQIIMKLLCSCMWSVSLSTFVTGSHVYLQSQKVNIFPHIPHVPQIFHLCRYQPSAYVCPNHSCMFTIISTCATCAKQAKHGSHMACLA